jgi:glutamate-1-semialdehyde 2,1-aminomutase
LLVKAGSGIATLGIPDTPGVPKAFARHTLTSPFNDIVATEKLIHKHAKDLAAIIVEPVAGNMGVVPPIDEFLPWLRMITQKYEIVLIFDEVITGFRVQYGGAQARFKVIPDLTCLGKIIGGGLPIGAYGGRKDMMQMIAPAGPVYQAGTLSGNPVAVAAGIETIRQLKKPGVYKELERKSEMVAEGLGEAARAEKIPYYQTRVGSMLGGFFAEGPVTDYASAKKSDTAKFGKFFHVMLNQGIYLAPSQFEAMLLSTAHSTSQIRHTVSAARQAFKML